jgi:hypothetical protein
MTINESKLAELARKATPGEWSVKLGRATFGDGTQVAYVMEDAPDPHRVIAHEVGLPEAAFIAAASPDVVLALLQALASAREDARRARLVASDAGMEEIAKLEAEVGAMRDAAVMLTEDLAKVTRERDEAIGLAEKALDLKWSRATRRPAKVTAIRERLATIRKEASE